MPTSACVSRISATRGEISCHETFNCATDGDDEGGGDVGGG